MERANTNVVVAYDATSAAGAAAGDFATKHEQQLAGKAVAAGALARSKGNYITQVHVASHNGQPGNELVDCLASHACESGCSTNSPHPEVLNAILHENVLDWMWLLCERGGVTHPDIQCDGSFHSTAASSVARVPWSCPADLQPAVGKQRAADCESSFLCLRLVTYNTLSLLTPGQSSTLEREMRRLQIHVLGLQECREDTEAIKFHNGICKIAGPANAGHLGCQVWIDCEKGIADLPDGTKVLWQKKAFSLLYGSPRILIVGAQAGRQRFALVVAHACTATSSDMLKDGFWGELRSAVAAIPRGYLPLWFFDANARFELGTLAPLRHDSNAVALGSLAEDLGMRLSGNVDAWGTPFVTWLPPGNSAAGACIDYVAVPREWQIGTTVLGALDLLDVRSGYDHFPAAVEIRA